MTKSGMWLLESSGRRCGVTIYRVNTLTVPYVAFGGGEEEGEDGSPRPIPCIGGRGVHGMVL